MPDHAESPQPTVLPFPASPPLALAPPPAAPARRRGLRGFFRRRQNAATYPMQTTLSAAATPAPELAIARTVPARPPAPASEPEAVATPAPRGYVRNPAAPDVTDAAERTGVWSSRNAAAAAKKGLEAQNAWANARESLHTLIPEERAATRVLTALGERETELRTQAELLLAESDAAPDESKAPLRSQARSFLAAAQVAQREAVPVERKRNELTVRIDSTPQRVYDETQIIIRYFWLEVETDAMAAAEEEGVYRTTEEQGYYAQLDFEEQFRRMHIPLPAEIETMIADMRRICAGPSEDVA